MSDATSIAAEVKHACLGLEALGTCVYDPTVPTTVYFSLGEVVAALGFTLAVQQLLKPIYHFRLTARHLSLTNLYVFVFAGALAAMAAALLPSLPLFHNAPWSYPIIWELIAALFFFVAYGAIVVAIVRPVQVRPRTAVRFVRASAQLLSRANEKDHCDYVPDLVRSLPTLIKMAGFSEHRADTSAFFDFTHRVELKRASYAWSFLGIIADPVFCKSLVKLLPWHVGWMLQELEEKQLHSRGAEAFVRELARQAILCDDSMMTRELGYHGFATAPLLSDSLFAQPFILRTYDPFSTLRFTSDNIATPSNLRRFNSAAKRALTTIIEARSFWGMYVPHSISNFYEGAFSQARSPHKAGDAAYEFVFEMQNSVDLVTEMAEKVSLEALPHQLEILYCDDPHKRPSDLLTALVNISFNALASISNDFKGPTDIFWGLAISFFQRAFPSIGEEPDGMTPFQQRLALRLVAKLRENMDGWFPAVSRILLACIGPYHRPREQKNRTAFMILKDAMYYELQRFPTLAGETPEKISYYLPDNVTYDPATQELRHTYILGEQAITKLSALKLEPVSLLTRDVRR